MTAQISRRRIAAGAAWSVPAVIAASSAPASAASIPACGNALIGNLGGIVPSTSTITRGGNVIGPDGLRYYRWDATYVLTNTWTGEGGKGSVVTDLAFVIPHMFTGAYSVQTPGGVMGATWNEAGGYWTSNYPTTLGQKVYVTNFGTSTPAPREPISPYTVMPYYPTPLIRTDPYAATPAEFPSDGTAYVIHIPVGDGLATGESVTVQYSWLVQRPGNGLMETYIYGDFMGTACSIL